MDMPSPDELSRLGVWGPRKLVEGVLLALGDFLDFEPTLAESPLEALFLIDVFEIVEAAVEGLVGVGGCGNEPMLTVLRTGLEGIADGFSVADETSWVAEKG